MVGLCLAGMTDPVRAADDHPFWINYSFAYDCDAGPASWILEVKNISNLELPYIPGPETYEVVFTAEGESTSSTVAAGELVTLKLPVGVEGTMTTASFTVTYGDSSYSDSASFGPINCEPDGTPSATIEVICPEDDDGEILVAYAMSIEGAAWGFELLTPGGAIEQVGVADTTEVRTYPVAEDAAVDVWVRHIVDEPGEGALFAELNTVADCAPPAQDGESGGVLPDTGGSPALWPWAAAVVLTGLALRRLSTRRQRLSA